MQFRKIIGQEEVKRKLVNSVRENRVSHAQLFHGPEGSGKLALAIAYAQFINCRDKRNFSGDGTLAPDSCGQCPSCIKYQMLAHPDLHFIYPVAANKEGPKKPVSSDFLPSWRKLLLENDLNINLGMWHRAIKLEKKQGTINAEDCSELLHKLSYSSYESEYKVMIIWMVEKLYHAAAPKILKILEEPPDKTLFILIAEKTDQIIPTILSRTQLVRIPRHTDDDIASLLSDKIKGDPHRIASIVALAEGNALAALELAASNDDGAEGEFTLFSEWMRLLVKPDYARILEYNAMLARENRERINAFLAYGEKLIRHAMLANYGLDKLSRLTPEESLFIANFRRFITPENIAVYQREFEKAQEHIDRNANAMILLTDLSLTFSGLLLREYTEKHGKR
jgi:DNA polymerase-3 subunit delta'